MLWPEQYMLFTKHFSKQLGFKCFPILWEDIIKMCAHEYFMWH